MGDPEVGDLHLAGRADQQVPGLDVPVHQARRVRRLQARGGLGEHVHGVGGSQRPGRQHTRQGRPVHQLHHQVRRSRRAVLAVVVDLRDARMGHRPGVPGLGPEPGQHLRVLGVLRPQQLDRHRPAQHEIRRPPDLAHPAVGHTALQAVAARKNDAGWGHNHPTLPVIRPARPKVGDLCASGPQVAQDREHPAVVRLRRPYGPGRAPAAAARGLAARGCRDGWIRGGAVSCSPPRSCGCRSGWPRRTRTSPRVWPGPRWVSG